MDPCCESSRVALHGRVLAWCEAGKGRLVHEAPPSAQFAKSLVVQCATGASEAVFILCVLPLGRRLCLRRVKAALASQSRQRHETMRLVSLATPVEAQDVVGCPMGIVPPVCIEPPLLTLVDLSFFGVKAPDSIVAGAAHRDWKLLIPPSALLGCGARVAD